MVVWTYETYGITSGLWILSVMGDDDEAMRGSALSLLLRMSPLSAHASDLYAHGGAVGRSAEVAGGSHTY